MNYPIQMLPRFTKYSLPNPDLLKPSNPSKSIFFVRTQLINTTIQFRFWTSSIPLPIASKKNSSSPCSMSHCSFTNTIEHHSASSCGLTTEIRLKSTSPLRRDTVKILKSLTNSICPFTILVPMFKASRVVRWSWTLLVTVKLRTKENSQRFCWTHQKENTHIPWLPGFWQPSHALSCLIRALSLFYAKSYKLRNALGYA